MNKIKQTISAVGPFLMDGTRVYPASSYWWAVSAAVLLAVIGSVLS